MLQYSNSFYRFLLGLTFLSLSGHLLIAQGEVLISYEFENEKLSTALQQLEEEYNLLFAYDEKLIAPLRVRAASMTDGALNIALIHLLKPLNLGFEVLQNQFVLIKKLQATETGEKQKEKTAPSICGIVQDSLSKQSLAYSNILLKGSSTGAQATEEGRFRLEGPFGPKDSVENQLFGL